LARPREFEIETALDQAMDVFWRKGYDGACLPDLLKAMGIARGSFYKAFADKRSVYLAALERYRLHAVEPAARALSNANEPGLHRIAGLLRLASAPAAQGDRRGCFLCNAAVDQAPEDANVQAKLQAMSAALELGLVEALRDTPAFARAAADLRQLEASRLSALYVGLRVMARAGRPAAELDAVIDQTLATLSHPLYERNSVNPAQFRANEPRPG